jgi:uncharacterized protein YidB (DUF937 family)
MSFFESIKQQIDKAATSASVKVEELEKLTKNLISDEKKAELNKVLDSLKEKGFGPTVQSWISGGENQPISADKIKDALGVDKLQELAKKAEIKVQELPETLSKLLPQLVDKLTPEGKIPEQGLMADAYNFLKKITKSDAKPAEKPPEPKA